ncbi:hypothetical protein I5907_01865 [Panacibacter sp. DH6]|uniref:DUF4878 domain-containing protein n=1 Tax=Panacibacter microcysteis TaxID=2793269 RepID=A0A931GSZ3_9BACT|nr:hypothetical protein [Panacibacter microcysteis]MBG9374966.1 hypothetical protein [Panacibacter microcysteis]
MKYFAIFIAAVVLNACDDGKHLKPAENAFDAGREFIDGCLKGDFDRAAFYMIRDVRNTDLLNKQESSYKTKDAKEKEAYSTASINIFEDAVVADSIHIINFQNSYDKIGRKVKVIFRNEEWLVDFKYTFDGNL